MDQMCIDPKPWLVALYKGLYIYTTQIWFSQKTLLNIDDYEQIITVYIDSWNAPQGFGVFPTPTAQILSNWPTKFFWVL